MSKLYDKLNKMSVNELESLLKSGDEFGYKCDRKVFLALVIKLIKQKKLNSQPKIQVL
ncbi:MAG: hypothetical protein KC646_07400 [Candidatus Cloacimonetes bacterium]|nr:hypothetical protein [Candidatus Cloacimonadota bacterium]